MKTTALVLLTIVCASALFAQVPTSTPGATATATPLPAPTATPGPTLAPESQPVPATSGTIAVTLVSGSMLSITPTGACTFNSSGIARVGKTATFVITTAGISSFVLTWGTNFKAAGTLATGTVAAKKFAVTFRCVDGTTWIEIARTAAM